MTNSVYIAGSCKNVKAVKYLMTKIESWGHRITFDWTGSNNNNDIGEYVKKDIDGIQECDNFVYCMDGIKSRGKYFELGYATALNKPIIIYILPTHYYMTNAGSVDNVGNSDMLPSDMLPFDMIIENDSVFIKSRMYPILSNIDELKTWLDEKHFHRV